MVTHFHIVAVHHPTQAVLCNETPRGWLLPMVCMPHHATNRHVLIACARWVGADAFPRCIAIPAVDTATDSADIAVVVDVHTEIPRHGLVFRSTLDPRRALMSYQSHIPQMLRNADPATEPFIAAPWRAAVTRWVADHTGDASAALVDTLDLRRVGPTNAVMSFVGRRGPVYFKAETRPPHLEARLSTLVASVCASAVAPSVAFDSDRGWWLTAHVQGTELRAEHWPRHHVVLETWLDLQDLLRDREDAVRQCGTPIFTADHMREATAAAFDARGNDVSGRTHDIVTEIIDILETGVGTHALLHLDAAPRNLWWTHRGHAVFLDLESVCIGHAIAFPELITRKLRDSLSREQLTALRDRGARHLAQRLGVPLASVASLMGPATDLVRLAHHYEQYRRAATAAAQVAWTHVAADFVARPVRWIPPQ